MASIASTPEPHSSMAPISGSSRSKTVTLRRASGSSSTTRARIDAARFSTSVTQGLLQRQGHDHFHAVRSGAPHLQLGGVAVQDLQTRAQIGEADAGALRLPILWKARAVVVDAQADAVAAARASDADAASRYALGNAMLDGVLDQRLQQQIWNLRVQQVCRDVHADPQTFPETNLLDVDIALQIFDFLGKGHLRTVRVLGGATQELAEPDDHAHRRVVSMIAHETGDGIERVEHEVRLHLPAQRG